MESTQGMQVTVPMLPFYSGAEALAYAVEVEACGPFCALVSGCNPLKLRHGSMLGRIWVGYWDVTKKLDWWSLWNDYSIAVGRNAEVPK